MSRRRGPEGKIQDAVIEYAREKWNAYCKKNEKGKYGSAGFLDFSIYPVNRPHFVLEFKAPRKPLTPLQAHVKQELESRGHEVHVIDDVVEGRSIIDSKCK